MTMSLDAYRARLVIIVLYAESAETIEHYIESAINVLKRRKIKNYTIFRFVAKMINQFDIIRSSAPQHQVNNINVAKNYLINLAKKGD